MSFSSKRFKNGAYSSAVTVIVLVVILFINLLVSRLDLKVDLSESGYFTMGDVSKTFVAGIEDEIKIYYLAVEGNENEMVKGMVDKYASASSHISVELKDPQLYPNFVYQYVDEDTRVYLDSVIVENVTNGRSKFISSADMVLYSYDSNYNSYLSGYDVEGQITSALQYVTSENLPKIYVTSGHGELALASYASEYLGKQNIEIDTLETLTAEEIPDDCQALMIIGPNKDFTESEVELIQNYMVEGGDVVLYFDYVEDSMTNLKGLMASYGVGTVEGVVLETQSSHMINNLPYMIVPDTEEHDVTESVRQASKYVGAYMPVALTIDADIRGSVERAPLLTSSEGAFSKINMSEGTFSKTEEDIEGPFCLGVAVTEEYNDVTTNFIIYSGSALLDNTFVGVSSLGNAELFTDTLNWVTEREDTVLSIPKKEYSQKYLTLTSAEANRLSLILVAVIPLIVFVCGFVVWFKRRKK